MRSFRFDPNTKRAVLNDKVYFMRGSNVCAYRFFEDSARGDRPWRADWVRRLHQKFREMHWNSLRYCIGFPPEFWYDIADEEGFLIQDEFPIWIGDGDAPEEPVAAKIIPQYTEWMRERWNHPCVVIWDGQNETFHGRDRQGDSRRAAVGQVESALGERLERAAKPRPIAAKSHPYFFIKGWDGKEFFHLRELEGTSRQAGSERSAAEARRADHHQRIRLALDHPRRPAHQLDAERLPRPARPQCDAGRAANAIRRARWRH